MPSAQSGASTAVTSSGRTARTASAAAPTTTTRRRAAAVGEHAQRAAHQRLAVQLDERLGAAHAAPRARGEQQTGGYRLITVCGCS